jgi:hypothetical protein
MGKLKTYRGFEDLPVYNFYQIISERDFRYFYKGYLKGNSLEISEDEELELVDRFQKVFDERVEYTNDTKTREYYRKLAEISDLEMKLFRIQNTFNVLIDIEFESEYFDKFVKDFEEEGYKYTTEIISKIEVPFYFKWLKGKIRGFRTKVKVKKSQYKDILTPPTRETGVKFDLMKEKILLEEILNRSININKCSIKEWSALVIRASEKAKANKAQIEKIKSR